MSGDTDRVVDVVADTPARQNRRSDRALAGAPMFPRSSSTSRPGDARVSVPSTPAAASARGVSRRGALVSTVLLAVTVAMPPAVRAGVRPELLQGDWALLVEGDRSERALSIGAPVTLPGGLRFEASVFEGRRARGTSGAVRDEAGAAVLLLPLPGGGQLTLRQVGVDRWDGTLQPPRGAVRSARIVRYAHEEPPSLPLARQAPLRPDSRVRVLYFGADDCVYCRSWEGPARQEGAFLGSETARRVELVKVKRPRTVHPPGIEALPEDLRARVPAEPRLASFLRAAPGWLVVIDEDVVLSRTGLGAWSREVEPFVAVLAQRLGAP